MVRSRMVVPPMAFRLSSAVHALPDCVGLEFGVVLRPLPSRVSFSSSRRRLSCCKWRRQARGSNCIPCKIIVFWPYL